ncbi:hypothetical protein [Flavicella sediminum]|uniref:hypothetical protein n=1 Tax=Flavicella sediminum TaxID=2585141 RepID=UPI001120B6A9|nr:hypothetical protein [Flavicella sediminum]
MCYSHVSYSQKTETESETPTPNAFKGGTNDIARTKFIKPIIELKKGSLISNVLKVINNSKENLNFTVDVLLPSGWNSIIDYDKVYSASVRDTIIIPVLIVPSKLNTGSSEVIINAFLIDLDGQQIGDNAFVLKTKKKISWDVVVKSANKFYFKNEEYNKKFEYSIINKGNYKQDIFVNHLFPKRDLFLSDTIHLEDKINNPSKTISLEVGEETALSYYASAVKLNKRNSKKISITNYKPNNGDYFKKYGMIINSSEPKSYSKTAFKKSNKVSFIKLPNETELQPFGYPSIPMTFELNVQNILSDYPFMSMNFRGLKQLNEEANLVYSAEINYTRSYYDNDLFKNIPWYLGYYDDTKSVELGQVSADIVGISSFGKGIRGSYKFGEHHKVSGFLIGNDGIFGSSTSKSYGGSYNLKVSDALKLVTKIGHNENNRTNRNIDVISLQPKIRINRRTNLNLSLTQSTLNREGLDKVTGYLYNANFSTSFFKRFRSSINGRYNDKNFSGGNYERLGLSHRVYFDLNDRWSSYMTNSYQSIKSTVSALNSNIPYHQVLLFNNVILSKKIKNGSLQPGIYYDYKLNLGQEIQSKGLTFRTSTYNYSKNLITSMFLKGGYTKTTINEPSKELFNAEVSGLIRYKTWNLAMKYNYGTIASINTSNGIDDEITPQLFRISLQNQYVLKNNKLVLESSFNYNYQNTTNSNSIGFYPELYYFSDKGWRYSLRVGYSYSSIDYSNLISFDQNLGEIPDNRSGQNINSNLNIGFSLRKNLGIRIPFLKKNSSNLEFISFLDINGNGLKDDDETTIKNVVVKLDDNEVITSNSGVAHINKAPNKKYALDIFPLEELEGWFPNVQDSLFVGKDETVFLPFVRGVKIYGDVILDRQKIAVADEKPIDLSRIKITATKDQVYHTLTDSKGHFEFYLPNGKYILNMDDSILAKNLRLSRNNIPLVLKNTQDGAYVSFYIIEKRRKVIIRDFSKKKR